jgi:IclR family transcriptional regulator, KDG regulon repressor
MKFNTLTKSIQILDLFLSKETVDENEISEAIKMPRSTTYKYLSILREYKLLDYDFMSKQYTLGSKFLEYSRARYSYSKIDKIVLPFLKSLYNEVQETVTLDVSTNDNKYYSLEKVQKEEGVGFIAHPRSQLPLHCGASGLLLLAFSEKNDIEYYLKNAQLVKCTEKTVVDENALRKKLGTIKRAGYAYSAGEAYAWGWAVAAPVFDHLGKICASLCVLGLVRRMERDRIEQIKNAVMKYAKEITENLGFKE